MIFAVAVIGIYAQVIEHEFVIFDDHGYVTHNTHVKKGLTLDGLLWAFHFSNDLYWHPMTWMSHMLDVEIFGMKAGGHLMMRGFDSLKPFHEMTDSITSPKPNHNNSQKS
ncbi:MAG: hypothetical protein ABF291_09235 [Desulfobacterales bacterium]